METGKNSSCPDPIKSPKIQIFLKSNLKLIFIPKNRSISESITQFFDENQLLRQQFLRKFGFFGFYYLIFMILGGLQKLTLIDYPGHIAATVFTVGCNFRCPFCHNPELVSSIKYKVSSILEDDFFKLLSERQGKLEGVCITGGEPTIQPDIVEFIGKIKSIGYKVKLDTNGARPDVLRKLYGEKLLDYVAMDIKNSLERYNSTTNSKVDVERIRLSVELIRNSGVDYEFRTTVVPGLHKESDFSEIGKWLEGAKKYVLQAFEDKGKILDPRLKKTTKGKRMDLEKISKKIGKYFGKVEIR